ncbi:MAG TPA: hypothetical protein VM911_12970 [Pyrinomonadaceae bacterium]|nr:hypothetical protein [Pyrinomonadaceae bacterium]
MQSSRTAFSALDRRGERGGTRLKFLIVIALLAAVAYSGYNFIPVAYQAYLFKDYMQTTVDKATALGQPADWVVTQLKASGAQYDVPPNADVKAQTNNGRMEARVRFSKPVALPFYTYMYTFDNTARSTDLFTQKPNP